MSVMVDSVTRFEEIEERDEVHGIAIMHVYNVVITMKRVEEMDNGEMNSTDRILAKAAEFILIQDGTS